MSETEANVEVGETTAEETIAPTAHKTECTPKTDCNCNETTEGNGVSADDSAEGEGEAVEEPNPTD